MSTNISLFLRCAVLLVLAVLMACNKGVESVQQARIDLYQAIDGVKIGDNETIVKQKLGDPNNIIEGDFPGVIFEYTIGRFSGLHVAIYSQGLTPSGVVSISVSSPYSGTTKEGIGIGSRQVSVRQILGQPASKSQSDSTSWDRYEAENRYFVAYYRTESVESLTLGLRF
jgi:hypothetical protein